jgi:hypothetical protein
MTQTLEFRVSELIKGLSKYTRFKKSGGLLYLPQAFINEQRFPFDAGDSLEVSVENERLIVRKIRWWEMLDWAQMSPSAIRRLPVEIQTGIERMQRENT